MARGREVAGLTAGYALDEILPIALGRVLVALAALVIIGITPRCRGWNLRVPCPLFFVVGFETARAHPVFALAVGTSYVPDSRALGAHPPQD